MLAEISFLISVSKNSCPSYVNRSRTRPKKFLSLPAVVALSDWGKLKVACGTWLYWLIVLAIVPVVGVVTLIARQYLLRKRQLKLVGRTVTQILVQFRSLICPAITLTVLRVGTREV